MFYGWFDGGSRGNPGPAGSGWVLKDNAHNIVNCGYVFVADQATNNVAEYRGLLALLQAALAFNVAELHVYGDSKLVIMQVTNQWKVNLPHLRVLCRDIQVLVDQFHQCTFEHVLRALNSEADYLSNMAMDTQTTRLGVHLLQYDHDPAGTTSDGRAVAVRIQRDKEGTIIQNCHVWCGPTWTRNGWRLPRSIWVNPYQFSSGSPQEAYNRYKMYIENDDHLKTLIPTLRGKQLGCICNHGPLCHAALLADLANADA